MTEEGSESAQIHIPVNEPSNANLDPKIHNVGTSQVETGISGRKSNAGEATDKEASDTSSVGGAVRACAGREEGNRPFAGQQSETETMSKLEESQSLEQSRKGIAERDQATSVQNEMPSRRPGPRGSNSTFSQSSVTEVLANVGVELAG